MSMEEYRQQTITSAQQAAYLPVFLLVGLYAASSGCNVGTAFLYPRDGRSAAYH